MTNFELGQYEAPASNHLRAEQRVGELSIALSEVAFSMRLLARNSALSNVDHYLPDEMSRLRKAVDGARGLPIQGEQLVYEYFIPAAEIYSRGKLRFRRNGSYDFQGVIRGVGEVPTPALKVGESVSRLCITVDPLYTLSDPTLSHYYAERGWIDQLRHPFAQKEHQDTTLCLRVDSISEKGVHLVDHWKAQ